MFEITFFFYRFLDLLEDKELNACLMSEDSVVSLPPITNSETTKVILAFYEICFTETPFGKCFGIDEYMPWLTQKRFLPTFEKFL